MLHLGFVFGRELHHRLEEDRVGEYAQNEKDRLEEKECAPLLCRDDVNDENNDSKAVEQEQCFIGNGPDAFIEMFGKLHSVVGPRAIRTSKAPSGFCAVRCITSAFCSTRYEGEKSYVSICFVSNWPLKTNMTWSPRLLENPSEPCSVVNSCFHCGSR